jgi:hypothetical protein
VKKTTEIITTVAVSYSISQPTSSSIQIQLPASQFASGARSIILLTNAGPNILKEILILLRKRKSSCMLERLIRNVTGLVLESTELLVNRMSSLAN